MVFLLFTVSSSAKILPFFTPSSKRVSVHVQGFVADDPVSLKAFFDEWQGAYSPRSGDNVAVELFRVDAGMQFKGVYIGYFYQWDTLMAASRGFVEGFHALKRDISPESPQSYDLGISIDGIERHGAVCSKEVLLYEGKGYTLRAYGAGYLSYDTDTQHGTLKGAGTLFTNSTYSASAVTDYFYMENLLYDGREVEETYGIGYGIHLGLAYDHTAYGVHIHLKADDLLARTHWNSLPYSLVYIETENQSFGEEGYISYDPTVSGWELYKDYVQKIIPKYHIDIQKEFAEDMMLEVGYEEMDYLHMPYISIAKIFDSRKVELFYEHRFESIGMQYEDKYLKLSFSTNGLDETSAISLGIAYRLHF